jgi:type IX secretion system PorP/SprF family membrane protein
MKNNIRFIVILLTYLFTEQIVTAQSDISMITHWYNRANYNPASIARIDYLYLFSNVRQQWLGVDGAPQVVNIQASEYVHKLRSAFGLSLVGDKIGVTQSYNPMLSYAYRIAGKRGWSMSLGLAAGILSRSVNGSLFDADNDADNALYYSNVQSTQPDVNTGFEFQNENFVVGASSTHITTLFNSISSSNMTNHRYAYFIYKSTKPELFNYNVGLQIVNRNNLTVLEGNVNFRIKRPTGLLKGPGELFDVGMTLRTSKQLSLLLGTNILPDLRMGYAYDQTFGSNYNRNGTHEIMIEYRIPTNTASPGARCGRSKFWYN